MGFISKLKKIYNVLRDEDDFRTYDDHGTASSRDPSRTPISTNNKKSIIAPIMSRLAIDVANLDFRHIRVGANDRYEDDILSGLNECMTSSANIDQTGRAFFHDVTISLLDEGVVALTPIVTDHSIENDSWDVLDIRVGKVVMWYPKHVKVEVYNDKIGRRSQVILPKEKVAIVENPLSLIMNEPSSTLVRLISRLNTLDSIANGMSSGKLDLIIQLPYQVKTDARKKQADSRRDDLETQLTQSKFGIAYSDATEKIIQLNRPVTNMLLEEVVFLSNLFYTQVGITEDILKGTASEDVVTNYYNTSVGPIAQAIFESMQRSFLTKTARSQGHRIRAFRDPFRHLSASKLANTSGIFSQNAVVSANEIRALIGKKPDEDPESDKLRNKNINPVEPTPEKEEPNDPSE